MKKIILPLLMAAFFVPSLAFAEGESTPAQPAPSPTSAPAAQSTPTLAPPVNPQTEMASGSASGSNRQTASFKHAETELTRNNHTWNDSNVTSSIQK